MPRPKSDTSKDVNISFRAHRKKRKEWSAKAKKATVLGPRKNRNLTSLITYLLDAFRPDPR